MCGHQSFLLLLGSQADSQETRQKEKEKSFNITELLSAQS